jgi:hypothetical protein
MKIGDLQPDKPEFKEIPGPLSQEQTVSGIRYRNLWGYNLVDQVANDTFLEGLELFAAGRSGSGHGASRPDLLGAVLRVNDKAPGLRIIVDHLPSMMGRLDATARTAVEGTFRELAKRPTISIKVSEVMRTVDGKPSTDAALYKPLLDQFFETFGEDKLLFGSDWPNRPAGEQSDRGCADCQRLAIPANRNGRRLFQRRAYGIVSETVAVCVTPPPVPLTVSV